MPNQRTTLIRLAQRLWARVEKSPEADGCWTFTGYRTAFGYGQIGFGRGVVLYTHRASWMVTHGPIPDGLFVLHKCDNPPCVRPDHLYLGDDLDNGRDMRVRDRWHTSRLKLAEAEVYTIRGDLAHGDSYRSIGRRFGISHNHVSRIARGQSWRWLDAEH